MSDDRRDGLQHSGSRVDLTTVFGGLRHLDASPEPAEVFTGLAGVCVPALCDECVIWISEQGRHPYRIRRADVAVPAAAVLPDILTSAPGGETTVVGGSAAGISCVEVADHAVIARFVNAPSDAPDYRGVMVCRWHSAHAPDDTEAALIGVIVDHATALVQRERTTVAGPPDRSAPAASALPAGHRIAAASGILMSLYHLSTAQARHLLTRASEHTHRPVIDIADTVLRTGSLPPQGRERPTGDTEPALTQTGIDASDRSDPVTTPGSPITVRRFPHPTRPNDRFTRPVPWATGRESSTTPRPSPN